MKNFKDFGIKIKTKQFIGDKIQVKKIINVQIQVHDFKVEPSKQKQGTELLTLQIEKGGDKRIVFTGSKILIDQIKNVPKEGFPFSTVIKDENDFFEFT